MVKRIINFILQEKHRTLILLILGGFLIRFALMPLSAHLDLLLASWREYLLVFKSLNYLNDLTETSLALYMKLIKPWFRELPNILDIPNSAGTLGLKEQAFFETSFRSLRYLFLFKIPFLILDFVTLAFVWQLVKNNKRRLWAVALWAFNPFLIYAVYFWGRYEIFPILFTILALLLIKKNQYFWAMFSLGLAITLRMPFVLILPFFVIYLSKRWVDLVKYLAIGLAPLVIITKAIEFIAGQNLFRDAVNGGFADFIVRGQIGNGFSAIAPFIMIYPIVLFLYARYRNKYDFQYLINFTTLGLLTYFGTSYFHPQYLAWLTPFMILVICWNRVLIWPYITMFIVYLCLADVYYNSIATTFSLLPTSYDFFSNYAGLRNQLSFYNLNLSTIVTVFHTMFVLSVVWLAYVIVVNNDQNR